MEKGVCTSEAEEGGGRAPQEVDCGSQLRRERLQRSHTVDAAAALRGENGSRPLVMLV